MVDTLLGRLGNLLIWVWGFVSIVCWAQDRVEDFLAAQRRIRVVVPSAPENGHQSATIAVMRKLRAWGFTGTFDVVIDDKDPNTPAKFSAMIPEYKAHVGGVQAISGQFMEVQRLSNFVKTGPEILPFGVSGATDIPLTPELYGVDNFLQLQPQGWHRPVELRVRGKSARAFEEYVFPELNSMHHAPPVPENVELTALVKKQSAINPALSPKLQSVAEIFSENPTYEIQSIYGMRTNPVPKMARLVSLFHSAQDAASPGTFRSGLVMPIFSKPSEAEYQSIKTGLDWDLRSVPKAKTFRYHFADGEEPEILRAALKDLGPRDLVFVKLGNLPVEIFEQAMRRSTLPPTVEGKNGVELLQQLGKAYLQVGDSVNLPGLSAITQREDSLAEAAFSFVQKGEMRELVKRLRSS